jgi:hypothetical protein
LAENGGIEIGGALRLASRPDAHAVAKEEDRLGLAFAAATLRFAAPRGRSNILR